MYGKMPHTPFGAQRVELLVLPLVKSSFCPINANHHFVQLNASPMSFWSGPPETPPHLKPTFLKRGGGSGGGVQK